MARVAPTRSHRATDRSERKVGIASCPDGVKAEEPAASAASGSSMTIVDEPASVRRLGHVFGGWTFLAHYKIELHELALGEAPEAAALDRAVVNKAILVTTV